MNAEIVGLMVALGVGLLMGIERERRKGEGPRRGFAGVRSFALVCLGGALAQASGSTALTVLGAALVAGLAVISHGRDQSEDPGITTEVALFVAYLIGVTAIAQPGLAAGVGAAATIVLAARERLHDLSVRLISRRELHDALVLLGLALVLLPLLPDRPLLGQVFNPRDLGRLVLLLLAAQAAGHVGRRLLGARHGLTLAGLASGFVSSTATVAAMGARWRAEAAARPVQGPPADKAGASAAAPARAGKAQGVAAGADDASAGPDAAAAADGRTDTGASTGIDAGAGANASAGAFESGGGSAAASASASESAGSGVAAATTVSMSARARASASAGTEAGTATQANKTAEASSAANPADQSLAAYVRAALMSNVATMAQLLLVAATVRPAWLGALWLPALCGAATILLFALPGLFGPGGDTAREPPDESGAFSLRQALIIAALLTGVQVVAQWARGAFGDAGLIAAAALAGLVDVHAAAAALFAQIEPNNAQAAARAIALPLAVALATNTASKLVAAFTAGGPRFGARVAPGLIAFALVFALALWFAPGWLQRWGG